MQKEISPKIIALTFGIIVLSFLAVFYVVAWQEPTAPPPRDNVPAPINVGTSYQMKAGPLTISNQFITTTSTLLATFGGNVGIGTTTPAYRLDVIGTLRATATSTFSANVGIGTATPTARLHVRTTDLTTVPFRVEALAGFDPNLMPGWKYRRPITISNFTSALTDYQVLVTLDTRSLITAGKMRSDCGDIRFTDSNGSSLLNYWLESGCNTTNTGIWVKVPNIPSGTKTIYLYYGNSAASLVSSISDTFIRNEIFLVTGTCDNQTYCGYTDNHQEFDYIRARIGTAPFQVDGSGYTTAVHHTSNIYNIYGYSDYYYSRYRFLFVPTITETYLFRTNSDDASEVTILPLDGYGGGIRTEHPYGAHNIIAYWYGNHNAAGTTCGSGGTSLSRNLEGGQGYWIDYMQSEWATSSLSQMCINDGNGWKVVNTTNFPNQLFARKYTTPEPTTSVGAEEIPRQQQTVFYIQNQTGNVGIGTTTPIQKLDVAGNVAADDVYLKRIGRWVSDSDLVALPTTDCYNVYADRFAAPKCDAGYYIKALVKSTNDNWDGYGAICCNSRRGVMGLSYNDIVNQCRVNPARFGSHSVTCPSED